MWSSQLLNKKNKAMEKENICSVCNTEIINKSEISTGYAVNDKNEKICYSCCAKIDEEYLLNNKKSIFYYSNGFVSNWPGSLKIKIYWYRTSYHNFCGRNGRKDIWFSYKGFNFHGVQFGFNTEICHITRLKNN